MRQTGSTGRGRGVEYLQFVQSNKNQALGGNPFRPSSRNFYGSVAGQLAGVNYSPPPSPQNAHTYPLTVWPIG